MTPNLKRGFLSLASARLVSSVIGTLSLPLVVRVLGPGGYGDYAFLLSAFSMMMILVSPAVTEGVQKFIAEERADSHWQEQVFGFYLRLAVLLAVVGSVVLVLVTWSGVVGRVLGSQFSVFFYLLAIYILTAQLGTFARHSLLGLELEHFSEPLGVILRVIRIALGLGLAVIGFGVAGFLVGHIVATLLIAGARFVVLRRKLSFTESLSVDLDAVPVRTFLSFNGVNIVLVVLMQSLFHTDVLMVQFLRSGEQTGYYKAALVLAEYIWLVPIALQRLMLHSASNLWSEEQYDRIQELASNLTRYVFLLTGLLAVGIYSLSGSFIPIYFGSAFEATVRPLAVLLPGAVGFALARPLYGINQATGRLKPLVIALAVPAVANAALNYLLIPTYGITGAAAATSLSYGSMFVLQVGCARYLGYAPLQGLRPVRLIGTVALAGPVIYGMEYAIQSDVLGLAIVPPAGFAVFVALALLLGAIDTSELQSATSVLPPVIEEWIQSVVFEKK